MWANGDQSNAQWWPMHYGYQYSNPNQDASADWATRAALWAQQRQAQEEMAKQHQQYYAAMQNQSNPNVNNQPHSKPPLPSDGTDQMFSQESSDPPLPPGESDPPLPPKTEQDIDNLETVAMEDEPLDTPVLEQEVAVTRLDYNHGQPVPLPEVGPPPPLPGMQTFDHNHGFTPAAGVPTPAYVPAQRFDYGHQSANYDHQKGSHPPASQWYDYDHMHGAEQHQHYETNRHHHSRHSSGRSEPQQSHGSPAVDYGTMSEVKKKALPLWIREGLEKMEREKQKKQKNELKKSLNSSTSSLSNISGYDHGKVESPVPSPEKAPSDEQSESSDEEEKERKKEKEEIPQQPRKRSLFKRSPSRSLSPQKRDISDDEVDYKSDSEKQEEMLLRMRKMLTEVLLSVTNDELHNVAKEAYNDALLAENRKLRSSGGLNMLKHSGALGVGDYGSDSESESEEGEPERDTPEQRLHPVYDKEEYDKTTWHSRSRSPRKQTSKDSDTKHSRSDSPAFKSKHEPGSSVSSEDESDISGSASSKKKKRRSKHRHRNRSLSSSPKRKSKHKHRRSRSRSSTPKKRKSNKRDRSRSHSSSVSRSTGKSRRHSRSHSRSPSNRKHRKSSRSQSRSPKEHRHRKTSRSRSRSPRSRRKRSRDKSPKKRRSHRSRSTSSDRYREGKRGSNRRSRSRSRSSTPRHKRH